MVMGLSKLQRAILNLAGTGHNLNKQIITREIMANLFGWIPARTSIYSGGISFDVEIIVVREFRKRIV